MNLNDIIAESQRTFYLGIIEKYNRRCRRIALLVLGGRKIADHMTINRTDMMRTGYEMAIRALTN